MNQIILTLTMLMSEGITLSDKDIRAIQRILWGAMDPSIHDRLAIDTAAPSREAKSTELIHGIDGLAKFFGVSVPTAQKLKNEGRFDEAQVHIGTRKLAWDREKLLEITRKK